MSDQKIRRREFLKLSALATVGAAAAACAPTPEVIEVTREVEKVVKETIVVEKEVEKEVTKVVEKVKEVEKQVTVEVEVPEERAEPPMLASRTAAGELAPIDERLPLNPMVIGGRDAIGVYGGEVRQIQAEWTIEGRRGHALRRLILLKPKMAYRARRERGRAVEELVRVLDPALDLVVSAPPRGDQAPGAGNNQDDNFQRFVEFFEAILAYHKSYGGN